MPLTTFHIVTMVITIFIVMILAVYSGRNVVSASGYSVGNRSSSSFLVAGSIAGTIIGGGATVGTAQMAFSFGLVAWWFTLGAGLAFIIMGLFYAKTLRKSGLKTIPEFLSYHYGSRAERLLGIISSIGILFSAVASSLPGIELISLFFHIPPAAAAVVLTAVVAMYTFFGGMKGAGVGGLLKTAIIWISLFIAGLSAWSSLSSLPAFTSLPDTFFSLSGGYPSTALANAFSMIVGILCTQTYIQAIFSASSPRTASLGCFLAALFVIPVGLPSVAIGMYMHAVEPNLSPILVLPVYFLEHTSPLLAGMALGGICLSLISSIGGLALGIGTMLSYDILSPLFHIRQDRHILYVTKLTVLVVLSIACVIAILERGTEILFWNYLSMTLRGAPVFLPLTAAIFFPGFVNRVWAFRSMVGSTLVSLFTTFYPLHDIQPLFLGLLTSILFLLPGMGKQDSSVSRETH